MFDVPENFRSGPFARSDAREAGHSARVLEGVQSVRLQDAVYCHRDHELTPADRRTTGVRRLQEVGLDHGPCAPLHFVPPGDDERVSVEAVFVAYCADARAIDAIKVGSMLLHLEWLELGTLQTLLEEQPWRPGCPETRWVIEHLDGRCRSMPEAVLLALVRFSGLPEPDVNHELRDEEGNVVIPDLWFRSWRQAVEYEGSHHQQARSQDNSDIERYLVFRTMKISYLQVTKERMRKPRLAMRQIHHALVQAGYDGPEPEFGELWATLFARLTDVVRPSRRTPAPPAPHPRTASGEPPGSRRRVTTRHGPSQ